MLALQAPWIADPRAFCQSSIAARATFVTWPVAVCRRHGVEGWNHPKGMHLTARKGFSRELEML
jgi:hypothetical protein